MNLQKKGLPEATNRLGNIDSLGDVGHGELEIIFLVHKRHQVLALGQSRLEELQHGHQNLVVHFRYLDDISHFLDPIEFSENPLGTLATKRDIFVFVHLKGDVVFTCTLKCLDQSHCVFLFHPRWNFLR